MATEALCADVVGSLDLETVSALVNCVVLWVCCPATVSVSFVSLKDAILLSTDSLETLFVLLLSSLVVKVVVMSGVAVDVPPDVCRLKFLRDRKIFVVLRVRPWFPAPAPSESGRTASFEGPGEPAASCPALSVSITMTVRLVAGASAVLGPVAARRDK